MEQKEPKLIDYLLVLWHWRIFILCITILCILIGTITVFTRKEKYQNTFLIYLYNLQNIDTQSFYQLKNYLLSEPVLQEFSTDLKNYDLNWNFSSFELKDCFNITFRSYLGEYSVISTFPDMRMMEVASKFLQKKINSYIIRVFSSMIPIKEQIIKELEAEVGQLMIKRKEFLGDFDPEQWQLEYRSELAMERALRDMKALLGDFGEDIQKELVDIAQRKRELLNAAKGYYLPPDLQDQIVSKKALLKQQQDQLLDMKTSIIVLKTELDHLPGYPYSVQILELPKLQWVVISAFIGLFLSTFLALLIDYIKTSKP